MEQDKKNESSQKLENTTEKEQEMKQGVAKKASLAIFILVVLLFLGIISVTDIISVKWGIAAGTIGLVIIAAILAIYLYKNELIEKLKKKKGD
ncbi:MAG: hypothetical protein RR963_00115 [Anaerovoracaceae bacterium]